MKRIETEVLVIGCGIAGGVAALQLADAGLPVTLITRSREAHESNTYYAQGGIIYEGKQDSPRLLIEDVLRAGAGRCDPASVALLAERGPALVRQILLERVGTPFDQNGTGLSLAREGGHSLPRIIHAADATGKAIATALLEVLQQHPQVTLLDQYTAVDLITSAQPEKGNPASPVCLGAYLLDQSHNELIACFAGRTILATGGLGQVFLRTSNPPGARGDGVAMAGRAGAAIADMEFVQFHPTTFYHPQARPFLISEAVRGAGARLVNANGEPFMQKYAPEWKDLAPRDIVARSIQWEMMSQGAPNVYLDLGSYIPTAEILNHFPTIYDYCRRYGIDITRDLVPVVPAAHYACGGVKVDQWGQTSLERLYAVGEVACTGLHGANRLASTSLLEGLVWGYQAAAHIQARWDQAGEPGAPDLKVAEPAGWEELEPAQIDRTVALIQSLMWEHVGLVRSTAGLEYALQELRRISAEVEACYRRSRLTDQLVGLRNMAQVALLISQAALNNQASQGCHYRLPAAEERRLFSWKLGLAEPALVGYNNRDDDR
jgi:L-aspartate oxidase